MPRTIKHYPTPTTTTYYIDEYLIDDVFRVDFQRKATEQPIWGYGSRNFDFVARGREIVTGNIVINFRYPGYLRNIIELKKSKDQRLTKAMIDNRLQNLSIEKSLNSTSIEGGTGYDDPELLNDYHAVDTAEHKMNVLSDLAANSLKANKNASGQLSTQIEQAKNLLIKRNLFEKKASQLPVSSMASPLDGETGAHPFDMTVRYGFQGVPGGFVRRFSEIVLIGESQVVQASASAMPGLQGANASSAQALLEVYPFFCRTIIVDKYNG